MFANKKLDETEKILRANSKKGNEMRIEIVEYYPAKYKKVPYDTGTLHVYLCDIDIDIRGIGVLLNSLGWFINMPFFTGYDEDKKKPVRYPIFNFTDPNKQRELVALIREEGVKYITENFINKDKPKIGSFRPYSPDEVKKFKQKKPFKTNQGKKNAIQNHRDGTRKPGMVKMETNKDRSK